MDEVFRRRRRVLVRGTLLVLLIGLAVGALLYLRANPPTESSHYLRCPFHELTGLHCPGCGMTRALHSLLNGDVTQALAYNSLGLVVLPFLVLSLMRSLWTWLWQEPAGEQPRRLWLTITLGILLVAYGVLRNLAGEPFCRLAPHELTTTP